MKAIVVFDWEIRNDLLKYDKMTLQEMIQLFDESRSTEDGSVKKPYWEIPEYLAYIFEFLRKDIANLGIDEELSKIYKRLDELEKTFKNHRHATDKLYSEKPSW